MRPVDIMVSRLGRSPSPTHIAIGKRPSVYWSSSASTTLSMSMVQTVSPLVSTTYAEYGSI